MSTIENVAQQSAAASDLRDLRELRENARLVFPEHQDITLSVREFEVEESISQLFRARVVCVSTQEDYDLSTLCGARLEFQLSGHVERAWRGICAEAEFLRVSEAGDGLATYEVILVPTMWRLTQRVQNRLFQHESIPTIVTQILKEWSIEHQWLIDTAKYPPLELRTQYGEPDFSFVSRLLEEVGLSFHFIDAGNGMSTLVLTDEPQRGKEREGQPIPFVDDVTLAHRSTTPQFMTRVKLKERLRPGRVTGRDYDFMRPRMPLFTQASASRKAEHAHEQYHFLPGLGLSEDPSLQVAKRFSPFQVADEVAVARTREDYARLRIQRSVESLQSERRVITYEASVNDLSPGVVFRISRHPRKDLQEQQSFLVIRHHVSGTVADSSSWVFAGACVSTDEPFRPPCVTPKPRIMGLQTAIVVGNLGASDVNAIAGIKMPGSVGDVNPLAVMNEGVSAVISDNTLYVDEHGRVRVQFPWDREHGFDKQSSIWMRVSQGWAGAGYGLFTIPRVGHEVLIAFLDGDPDSPLIVGRVHNAQDPIPYPLPANSSVSTWKTSSTPLGQGFNELRFDDASGREHVYIQAEKNMDQLVKNDSKQAVGGSATRFVQKHDVEAVGGSRTEMINVSEQHAVGLDQAQFVGMNRTTHVGVEDNTMVGTRWGVTMARGMTDRLVHQLDEIADSVGGVLRNSANAVLGGIPASPTADPAASPLAEMGGQLFSGLKDALETAKGYAMDPGPPPTVIEMVDRQIKLSTGEASILLDGPNVTISAQGTIVLHAMEHVSVLSEKEIAIGGRQKVALVSATDDVIVQAKNDLHLNPYAEAKPPGQAARLKPPTPIGPHLERCLVCEGAITEGPWGLRSCTTAAGELAGVSGAPLAMLDPDDSDASPEATTWIDELRKTMVTRQAGFRGDVMEHATVAIAGALAAVAPSLRRVVAWLQQDKHLDENQAKSVLEAAERESDRPAQSPGFYGLIVRYWMANMEEPAEVSFSFRDGRKPVSSISRGRLSLEVYLPHYQGKFLNEAALAEMVALLSVGHLPSAKAQPTFELALPLEGGALGTMTNGLLEGATNEVKNGN